MKERPILFSAPMVRALLAGTKTQTRRIAPLERVEIKDFGDGTICWTAKFSKPVRSRVSGAMSTATHSGGPFTGQQAASIIASDFCPHGAPGDRLWVRETWLRHSVNVANDYLYRADHAGDDVIGPAHGGWKPSIHMPRAACRLELEITGVRVEQLQDISEADCRAEGLGNSVDRARHWFRVLWEDINGAGSWDANPWVWVVEFRRLEATQ